MEEAAKIEEFIKVVLGHMQIPGEVSVTTDSPERIQVAIQAPEHGSILIGKNGQNLQALEHVVRAVCARNGQVPYAVHVDVNNYHTERTQELVRAVHEMAVRVQQARKSEALSPMTSYERRIVHTELATYSDLTTESVGQEPNRRVVIKPL